MFKHLILTAFFLLSFPAIANTEEFIVQNIAVDVTDESAVVAQEKAFSTAEVMAFESLLQKMVLPQDLTLIPAPSPEQIKGFITSFSIQDEKRSDIRYVAHLQYRFNSTAIRSFLKNYHVPFSEHLVHPVVIVPIAASSHSEEDTTLWEKMWDTIDIRKYTIPFILERSKTFPKELVVGTNATTEYLRTLGQKHKSSRVALIHFRQNAPSELSPEDSVATYLDVYPSLTQNTPTITTPFTFVKAMEEHESAKSLHQTLTEIERAYLATTQEMPSINQKTLEFMVPTETLAQWHKNLQILQGIPGLVIKQIKSISKSTAHVMVQTADMQTTTQQLTEKGFVVTPHHNYFILQTAPNISL